MATALGRKFTLLDVMLLIVAAAVGLALARLTLPDRRALNSPILPTTVATPTSHSQPALIELRRIIGSVVTASSSVYPSVMTFTIATLVLRLRLPRPRLRLVFRQPGAVGCSAVVLALIMAILTLTPDTIHALGSATFYSWMSNVWLFASRGAGMAVAGAWLALALSGRWRPEGSWVDRMGRVLSASWLVALFLEVAAVWSSFFY